MIGLVVLALPLIISVATAILAGRWAHGYAAAARPFGALQVVLVVVFGLVLMGMMLSIAFDTKEVLTNEKSDVFDHLRYSLLQAGLMALLTVPAALFGYADGKRKREENIEAAQ